MYISIPKTEEIYFSKTKEYFKEVLSSYSIGNYRSAIVMLYSITICDILLKLQELSDMYNDNVANDILKQINKSKSDSDNKSKSRWEKELVESVYDKTELLDLESYTNLKHLFDYRNFSAHPALNDNYELITPSQETTIALIKNTLDSVLIKPPIFIKKVVSMLTDDLKENSKFYSDASNNKDLQVYLQNKYFSKMSLSMRCETFKAMWKFCFRAPNDDCKENRAINCKAIKILIKGYEKEISEYVKDNLQFFDVYSDERGILYLVSLLSEQPFLYKEMSNDTKVKIDNIIKRYDIAKVVSWFKYSKIEDHLEFLKSCVRLDIDKIKKEGFNLLTNYYIHYGEVKELMDYYIMLYGNSSNYYKADSAFENIIEPNIERMSYDQIVKIIEVSNSNYQIYSRNASRLSNNIILKRAKGLIGSDFDFSSYPNFIFDMNILAKANPSEDIEDFSSDVFNAGKLPF